MDYQVAVRILNDFLGAMPNEGFSSVLIEAWKLVLKENSDLKEKLADLEAKAIERGEN